MVKPGTRVGNYEIEATLGQGGMATVYRARDVFVDALYAIKVLEPRYREMPEARRRFLDEAKIQAKHLDHPNIVKVFTIVANDEHAALVMELINGPSLESRVGEIKQRPEEIKQIMLAVLDGVGHAHAAGIIHRDLKPANVLLQTKGGQVVPKVTDFGIAKVSAEIAGEGKRSTQGDSRMGTLHYMSPEQIKSARDVTSRSDIWSLGAMLYELATSEVPFGGVSDYELMENIVHGRYHAPGQRHPGIDPVLAAVIEKALQPDAGRRFASCEEMAAALRGELRPPPVPLAPAVTAPAPVVVREPSGELRPPPARLAPAPVVVRTRPTVVVALGIGGVVGLIVVAAVVRLGGGHARRAGAHREADAEAVRLAGAANTGVAPSCPRDMVAVPGGMFTMGSPPGVGNDDEQPPHQVTLTGFCIDRTEVTVAAYASCVAAGACPPAPTTVNWTGVTDADRARWNPTCNAGRTGYDSHPINCVDWSNAATYCQWASARLPTEAEWEYAARGGDGRTYPWGNEAPGPTLLNACGPECVAWAKAKGQTWPAMYGASDGNATTSPVGSYPAGASPWGALDMAGNVWEWTGDWYGPYVAGSAQNPDGPTTGSARFLRRLGLLPGEGDGSGAMTRTS